MKPIPIQTLDDDARRLMARAAELARTGAYEIIRTDFLSPREQRLFYAAVASEGQADRLFFFGGARDAERRCAVLLPEWYLGEEPTGNPFGEERASFILSLIEGGDEDLTRMITPLSLTASEFSDLSHRDWLGAILALGIERTAVGDIAVLNAHRAVAFATEKIAPFVAENLKRAGSDAVTAAACELPEGFSVPHEFERLEASVASPRLDGVVRALTNLSRADAAALVKDGRAEINYFREENPDTPVTDGDVLSVRGYGKFIIDSANTVTRRGRNRLVARKYI